MNQTSGQIERYKIVHQEIRTKYDRSIFYTVVALVAIGFMAVFSASVPLCVFNHTFVFKFILSHIMWLIGGFWGMFFLLKRDYKSLRKYTFFFALFVIVMMLLVMFTKLGISINGAKRWLNLGILQFQPSELTKLAVIMLMAGAFSLKEKVFEYQILTYAIVIFAMLLEVILQPNLSMTIILVGVITCMYIATGKTLKYIILGGAIMVCLLGLMAKHVIPVPKFVPSYQIARVFNWKNSNVDVQGGGYQVFHSRIAIASGGLIGSGYGSSKEKWGWLPEAHTDFIFSVIAEEFGFWGCLIIISLFWTLLHRGLMVAFKCPDLYGRLLAVGISISITIQAFFNISVATEFLPTTGITLPFISYGGSSLMVSLWMIGILLNISKTQIKKIRQLER